MTSYELDLIGKDLNSKLGHILRYWGLGLERIFCRGEDNSSHKYSLAFQLESEYEFMIVEFRNQNHLKLMEDQQPNTYTHALNEISGCIFQKMYYFFGGCIPHSER